VSLGTGFAQQQTYVPFKPAGSEEEEKQVANANTVIIMASGSTSIFTRFAEEMQQTLDDKKEHTLRILPLLGNSGEQGMLDLLYLRYIDMAIMDDNMVEHFKQLNPSRYKNIDDRIKFITKLLDNELHLIARNEIKTIADLNGKKVNFYQPMSSTALLSEKLFKTLGIEVNPVYYHQEAANRLLKAGEIAAVARANGAPVAFVQQFKKADGVHFLPIDSSLKNYAQLLEVYSPAYLKHEDYPELIPPGQRIPTIANSTVLATYNWPENTDRYRKVANFVNKLFDNIDKFMLEPRHPKWRQINLAANVTGWKRFKPAEDWLIAHKTRIANSAKIREAFEGFLQEYKKANPTSGLDDAKVEMLTVQFFQWWDSQGAAAAARANP
jgi:TRAP transporter TAXI family solute receptor